MKRNSDIAALFQKHESKKMSASALATAEEETPVPHEDTMPPPPSSRPLSSSPPPRPPPLPPPPPPPPPQVYDINHLPHDLGERLPIASYNVNDQDAVRRAYILKGPCRTYTHQFESRNIGGKYQHFSILWVERYSWLEYSIKKDAAFCFICYLFKEKKSKGKGTRVFVDGGWRNWNRDHAVDKNVGGVASVHNHAQERYNLFVNPNTAIDSFIVKVNHEELRLYKLRLLFSLRCLRFLLGQGLAFCGHDEKDDSHNRGNFLELLEWLTANNEEVNKLVLKNAPGNCTLTSPEIQKQIIQCCAIHTRKEIIEELADDNYAILADESSDVSHKEQLAICLRYVDKVGKPNEHFLGVVHVGDTTSLSLKDAICGLLSHHHLTLTQIHGQGYDVASNMKGEIKGLKTLIMKESPSAYYIHCFAHQLQLVLLAVAKENTDCSWFFAQISLLMSIVGVSCKRHDLLQNVRAANLLKSLELGELETGSGLNQEMGLARPGDTRWGYDFKTIMRIIGMYPTIRDILIILGEDHGQKGDWPKIHSVLGVFDSFDFVFSAQLMVVILGYTNDFSDCLQRREQDIVSAISLVGMAKRRMQEMMSDGWDSFHGKVISFCNEHGIQVPMPDGNYIPYGRSTRFSSRQTNDDHLRREVYIGVIDKISQELDSRFDEVNMELLGCIVALNPVNSFASFDAKKVRRLAEFYPSDISKVDLIRLETQLVNYIDDMKKDENFKALKNLVELSVKFVEIRRHIVHDLVYSLLKFVLLLPVATASVERAFSAMNLVKHKLRNKMGDSLLDDCLVTFIERDIFVNISEDDIVETFMTIRKRYPEKNKKKY